jgi:hypothetical protein
VGVKINGTLWAWGANNQFQSGGSNFADKISPTQIGTDTFWETVIANGDFSFVIKNDGTIWGWGRSNSGQLGVVSSSYFYGPTTAVACPGVLGAESFNSFSDFSIYPNPATSVLNIAMNDEVQMVQVYSLDGKLVKETATKQVDVSTLQAGFYMVKITTSNNKVGVKKFIKQ